MGNIITQGTCTSASTSTSTRAGGRLTAALAAVLLTIGVAGCSGSDSKSSATTPAVAEMQSATTAAAAATTAAAAETTAPAAAAPDDHAVALAGTQAAAPTGSPIALPDDVTPFGTALAITATVTVEVPDVRMAVIALPQLVAAKGGAIFDSNVEVGQPETATATVTVKVRPQDLEDLIAGLGGLGELVGRTQQTEDVTDQLADTESRISTAQASVDRVRALLAGATNLDDVVRIENELTIRETNLEQLLASQRNVTARVQLATLTVVLTPTPPAPKPVPVAVIEVGAKADRSSSSVGAALRSGWNRFVLIVHAIVVALAYLAPLLGLALIGGLVAIVLTRLNRRRSPDSGVAEASPVHQSQ